MPAAAIDFDSLPTFTDEGGNEESFSVQLLTGTIAGTAEIHEGEVYIALKQCPFLMEDAKARELIVDALCKGRQLGMRRTFARKLRATIDS